MRSVLARHTSSQIIKQVVKTPGVKIDYLNDYSEVKPKLLLIILQCTGKLCGDTTKLYLVRVVLGCMCVNCDGYLQSRSYLNTISVLYIYIGYLSVLYLVCVEHF